MGRPLESSVSTRTRPTTAVVTIVAKNYLAQARVLMESVSAADPQFMRVVLLIDHPGGFFDPSKENFTVVSSDELGIPQSRWFHFKYSILELSTAVKPFFLSWLFRNYELNKIIYLDPDIRVYASLRDIETALDHGCIALTPHLTEKLDDDRQPSELHILKTGAYNLGFIGVRATPEVEKFLRWWQSHLYDHCLVDLLNGLFVDQRWIDLVPGMFSGVCILRDVGYNAAYWNAAHRRIVWQDGTVLVNGGPLCFFHFSGYDPGVPDVLSKHQDRVALNEREDLRILCDQYRLELFAQGFSEVSQWPYTYDRFRNGFLIPDLGRRLLNDAPKLMDEVDDPFSDEGYKRVIEFWNTPVSRPDYGRSGVTKLAYRIYQLREDVQAAMPDIFGKDHSRFLEWMLSSASHEHLLSEPLLGGIRTALLDPQDENHMLPPKELIYRVAGTSDGDWFVRSGCQSVKDIELALNSVGRTVAEHSRILDFGCGCGRIMLQVGDLVPTGAVIGVDIDAEAIAWLRPRFPESTVLVINEFPPMPFAAAYFDLVYCHSVFTHLDCSYQDRWLEELCRVCKPGALLVISFSGQTALHTLEEQWAKANIDSAHLRKELEESGILFIADDCWKNGPFPDFYHSTFHTVEYVREHWGRYFKILNHIQGGSLGFQDFIVMERTTATDGGKRVSEQDEKRSSIIPMPPEHFRALVGPKDDVFYDNPAGQLAFPEIPERLYTSVFDFGCGCGRQARQLMQQRVRPQRYVGVDIHHGMIAWCQSHLATIDPNFQFLHHNVYNPGIAPDNKRTSTAPFPVGSNEFTLVNAHSVFTHIYEAQTEFYLREIERILTSDGVARTTWFFFDRRGYPWLETWQHCLFVNAEDPTNAVIYDWGWFLDAVSSAGLIVRQTVFPAIPGHQWQIFLEKRGESSVHNFPAADLAAEWICGAVPSQRTTNLTLSNEIEALRNSWSWKLTLPVRKLADFLGKR